MFWTLLSPLDVLAVTLAACLALYLIKRRFDAMEQSLDGHLTQTFEAVLANRTEIPGYTLAESRDTHPEVAAASAAPPRAA